MEKKENLKASILISIFKKIVELMEKLVVVEGKVKHELIIHFYVYALRFIIVSGAVLPWIYITIYIYI